MVEVEFRLRAEEVGFRLRTEGSGTLGERDCSDGCGRKMTRWREEGVWRGWKWERR